MAQLFYRGLDLEFFDRYPKDTTNFYAVSGWLGASPISKLESLPFDSTIIYGLQRENSKPLLEKELRKLHSNKVSILYSGISTHAKCYLWTSGEKPLRALIGSANFSSNGLNNDYRETLLDVDPPDLYAISAYINLIKESSRICLDVEINTAASLETYGDTCEMTLFDPTTGRVQEQSALNWGFSNGNVTPNDGCIPIRKSHIANYPNLFKPYFLSPEAGHRERSRVKKEYEVVELIWDDGLVMEAMFEGSQEHNGLKYPKQIASIPKKSIMGEYIRFRLGKDPVSKERKTDEKITREDLERYGRNSISLSLIQSGTYSVDFSPKHILR
jgi:hypothetical protein